MIKIWNEDLTFKQIDYSFKSIKETEFDNCTFIDCNFEESKLSKCSFISCSFENCNFSNSMLAETGLKQVYFSSCKLIGIRFDYCSDFLFEVNFNSCILDFSVFAGKKMKRTNFIDCSLIDVDFSETDLTEAKFINCNLFKTLFSKTILDKANLTTAKNYIIDPEFNRIKNAKFSLPEVIGLLSKYQIIIE